MTHILVVEDEDHLAKGIRFNLQAEGYHVSVAGDGGLALEMIADASPPIDLVVLDLMLPGMSGYSVCETLREQGTNIPILMLSARTLPEDRTRGFDVGADQYLTKPFELDELLSRHGSGQEVAARVVHITAATLGVAERYTLQYVACVGVQLYAELAAACGRWVADCSHCSLALCVSIRGMHMEPWSIMCQDAAGARVWRECTLAVPQWAVVGYCCI